MEEEKIPETDQVFELKSKTSDDEDASHESKKALFDTTLSSRHANIDFKAMTDTEDAFENMASNKSSEIDQV